MSKEHENKLTIVIPAFNEEGTLGRVLEGIQSQGDGFIEEVIVVDDGSTDGTARIAEGKGARVIRHRQNMGYGASLKTGIQNAHTEFLVTMDSDGQHRPEDITSLCKLADTNDMVVGQRMGLMHSTFWRMPGKWVLGLMANYLTGRSIPDLNSGFRLIRREVALKYLHLCPSSFSFSTTITMALLSRGYRVTYVPICVERRTGKSTVSITTGFDTIILILRIATLFDPLRIFVPLSTFTGGAGIAMGAWYFWGGYSISGAPLLLVVAAILLLAVGLLSDQISQLRLERFE